MVMIYLTYKAHTKLELAILYYNMQITKIYYNKIYLHHADIILCTLHTHTKQYKLKLYNKQPQVPNLHFIHVTFWVRYLRSNTIIILLSCY